MNIVQARSPFIVTVPYSTDPNNTEGYITFRGSTGVEGAGAGEQIVFTKPNTGTMVWNMSNFIREFIIGSNQLLVQVPTFTDQLDYCYFTIERGYVSDGEMQEPISTTEYVGMDGYTNYDSGGLNIDDGIEGFSVLSYTYYKDFIAGTYPPFFEIITNEGGCDTLTITYTQTVPTSVTVTRTLYMSTNKTIKIPYTLYPFDDRFVGNVSITIRAYIGGDLYNSYTTNTYPAEECKYSPYMVQFVNRNGGWNTLTFYKASRESMSVTNSDFQVSPVFDVNGYYDPYQPQFKTFNTNAKKRIKLNTGWINEENVYEIEDMLLSERLFVVTPTFGQYPSKIVTSNMEFKKTVNEKMINYELEFEFAYNVINDVV